MKELFQKIVSLFCEWENNFLPDILNELLFIPLILFLGIFLKDKIYIAFKSIQYIVKKCILRINNQKQIVFYGRTNLIKDICRTHDKGKKNKCIVIYGNGGTGKTTIAKYMSYCCSIKRRIEIIGRGNIPNAEKAKKNTIYFFDYIYESEEEIFRFYNNLKDNSHITVVLLERELAIKNIVSDKINVTKAFNLNSKEYILSFEDLVGIISDNITYDFISKKNIYKKNNVNYSLTLVEKYVEQIITKYDPTYCRPIFAVILAKLYKLTPNFDSNNLNSIDKLYEEYWNTTMGKEKYLKLLSLATREQSALIDDLSCYSRLLILLCSCANLKIEVSFPINEANIKIYCEKRLINYPAIKKYIADKLIIFTPNSFKFFFPDNNSEEKYCIKGLEYDLLTAWLFVSSVQTSLKFEIIKLFDLINSEENESTQTIMVNINSFIVRAADENKEYFNQISEWIDQNITEEEINIIQKIYTYTKFIIYSKTDDVARVYYSKLIKLIDLIGFKNNKSKYIELIYNEFNKYDESIEYFQKIIDYVEHDIRMIK